MEEKQQNIWKKKMKNKSLGSGWRGVAGSGLECRREADGCRYYLAGRDIHLLACGSGF
jgi:hypothetical protein